MSESLNELSIINSGQTLVNENEITQFLRFKLYPDMQVMLPLQEITEVLKIKFGQIVPIPDMPPWVMGVYNWRGDILWMLDIGHLIGFNSWYQQASNRSYQTAIVLSAINDNKTNTSNIHLGLVVAAVEDIEICDTATIQSPPSSAVTTQLAPFLRGYWLQPEGEMILVLDGRSIVAAMPSLAN
ncbi:CheW protein [Chondrocystis sp. NIES-4102]|nr:CheW protein [Chondrocystis sp. NIES-4102]